MLYTPRICNDLFSRLINLNVNVHQLSRTTFQTKNIENKVHFKQLEYYPLCKHNCPIRCRHREVTMISLTVQTQLSNQVPHREVTMMSLIVQTQLSNQVPALRGHADVTDCANTIVQSGAGIARPRRCH